jgi:phosphoglycolate phosphatase
VKYPLILLDLDGTLVDSFADIAAGVTAACAALGMHAAEAALALVRRGAPLEEIYLATGGGERFAEFAAAYRAGYFEGGGCVASTRPYPGVPETLRALRELAPRPVLAVATTKRNETARRVLEATGLLDLVDDVVGSDGLPPKPDPAILVVAGRRAGSAVRRAIMVGDTDRDVIAARRAGAKSAAVVYGGVPADELLQHEPDHLLVSFGEVLAVVR